MFSMKALILSDLSPLNQLIAPASSRKCRDLPENMLDFDRAFTLGAPFLTTSTKGGLGIIDQYRSLEKSGVVTLTFELECPHRSSRCGAEWLAPCSRHRRRKISRGGSRKSIFLYITSLSTFYRVHFGKRSLRCIRCSEWRSVLLSWVSEEDLRSVGRGQS